MTDKEDEVKKAEEQVKKNTVEFETAINHLLNKVDDSGKKVRAAIQSVQETVQKPKRILKSAIGSAQKTAKQSKEAATHFAHKTRETSQQWYEEAKKTAIPTLRKVGTQPELFWPLVGLTGIVAAIGYSLGTKKSQKNISTVKIQLAEVDTAV